MGELERLQEENDTLRRRIAELESGRDPAAAFLESILAVIPAFILRANADLKVTYINHLSPGYTMEQVIGSDILAHNAPEWRGEAQRAYESGLAGTPAEFRSMVPRPDGNAYFQSYVAPVPEPDGSTGIVVVAFDMTEHHRRRVALEASEEKLRIAIGATGIGLWSWDMRSGVVEWDDRMRAITGRDEPLDSEKWIEQLVHPDDRAMVARLAASAEDGEFRAAPHRIVRDDGSVRWVLTEGQPVTNDAGEVTHMYGGVLDITRQQEMEEQVRHAQKLEAVGSLTAGVAHNFNNLLMAILPTLDMLAEVVPPTHSGFLDDATHAAERGAELVKELMTFAGQRRRSSRVVERPETLVQNSVAICRRTFDRAIALDVTIEDGLPNISCDAGAIEHALMNVLLNARDALAGGGGSVTVRVRSVSDQERDEAGLASKAWICIEVSDDGPGVPSDLRDRIFEPFFTTKGPRGTGLGLSTVYAVVKEHDGNIELESSDEGTTFRVYLPSTERPTGAVARAPSSTRSVLLIDDEEAVRRVVKKMLEVSGYAVIEAEGPSDALDVLDGQNPMLVLLDRSMPSGSGRSLLPVLRERLPEAKILYFTGQHIPPAERAEVDGVVQKPVRTRELVEAIDRVLS